MNSEIRRLYIEFYSGVVDTLEMTGSYTALRSPYLSAVGYPPPDAAYLLIKGYPGPVNPDSILHTYYSIVRVSRG